MVQQFNFHLTPNFSDVFTLQIHQQFQNILILFCNGAKNRGRGWWKYWVILGNKTYVAFAIRGWENSDARTLTFCGKCRRRATQHAAAIVQWIILVEAEARVGFSKNKSKSIKTKKKPGPKPSKPDKAKRFKKVKKTGSAKKEKLSPQKKSREKEKGEKKIKVDKLGCSSDWGSIERLP